MKLNQIIAMTNPIGHWTGERFGDNNVYDETGVNALVATNVSLGESGSQNNNLSSRSINLKGGYLQVFDTTFGEIELAERDFTICFGLRIPNRDHTQPISGFKTLISKWNPEQQFMIGFENGNLVAKVQTTTGLVEVEHDLKKVLYNNRWNWIQFSLTGTHIQLYLNGILAETANNSPVVGSVNNLFTIGGTINETIHQTDVLINDISFCSDVYDYFPQASYILPRTELEMWQNMNPTHLYDVGNAPNPLDMLHNFGSKDDAGYIVYDATGDAPYHYQYDPLSEDTTLRMPLGSYLTIDNPTLGDQIDIASGMSIAVHGQVEQPYGNSIGDYANMKLFDFRNNPDNNNGRWVVGYSAYRSDFYWLTRHGYDDTGARIDADDGYNDSYYRQTLIDHIQSGTKLYTFNGLEFSAYTTRFGYWTFTNERASMPHGYAQSLPYNNIKFWHCSTENTNSTQWSDLRVFGLFDYVTPESFITLVNYPRFKLCAQFLHATNKAGWGFNVHGYNSTTPNLRSEKYRSYDGVTDTNGLSFATNITDPNKRRNNPLNGAGYLPNIGNYTQSYDRDSTMPVDKHDFTICGFFWNRNTTERYRLISFHYRGTYHDVEVWMNSRNGEFQYGSVEFMVDKLTPDQHISLMINPMVDDGFHHLAFIRKGFELQIWVDGILSASKITPNIHAVYTTGAWRLSGGPLYYNDWCLLHQRAMTPREIEFAYGGYNDVVKGRCTLDNQPLPSTLLATDVQSGKVIKTNITNPNGKFEFELPKTSIGAMVNLLALAQDDNATNNVVVHGPYNMTTVYSKFSDEVLESSLSDMIMDMEPYAYYPMNDVTGTTIVDESGNNRDATAVGGVTLDQPAMESNSRSIQFNGIDGHIDLPDGYDDFTNGFTFEAWVKYDSFKNWSRVVSLATGINGGNEFFIANELSSDNLHMVTKNNFGTTTGYVESDDMLNASSWQHIACRIAPDGTYSLWANGIKVSEITGQALPEIVTRTMNTLGKSTFGQDGYYHGRMSQVATYMHPLSDEDIAKHAHSGFGKTLPTMKSLILQDQPDLYFPFDRLGTYVDAVDGDLTLVKNGAFDVELNSLVFNKTITGNNWLKATGYRVPMTPNGWAVEFSIKTGITHNDAIVISEWDQVTDTGTYKVQLDASNKVKVFVNNNSTVIESAALVNDDVWHHVVVDYQGDILSLYVDGVFQAALSVSVDMNKNDLAIGNSQDGSVTHHFEGKTILDDVAIYSHSIGEVRVTEHHNQFMKKKVF